MEAVTVRLMWQWGKMWQLQKLILTLDDCSSGAGYRNDRLKSATSLQCRIQWLCLIPFVRWISETQQTTVPLWQALSVSTALMKCPGKAQEFGKTEMNHIHILTDPASLSSALQANVFAQSHRVVFLIDAQTLADITRICFCELPADGE